MNINTLSKFKQAIEVGTKFKVIEHTVHKNYVGEIRTVSKVQTNGFYAKNSENDMLNGGKGRWTGYNKAVNWKFNNDETIDYLNPNGNVIMTIRMI